MECVTNKGVNKSLEFRGLQEQYLIAFVVAVAGTLMLFFGLSVAEVSMIFNIVFCLSILGVSLYFVFKLQKKHGIHGAMKLSAKARRPRALIYRKSIQKMFANGKAF